MWFKVDDQIPFHPKIIAVGNQTAGVWMRAGAWSGQQLTDGFIPEAITQALGATRGDLNRLVQYGLWDRATGGYQFHDWAQYQPSATQVRQERQKSRERMRELRANADRKPKK